MTATSIQGILPAAITPRRSDPVSIDVAAGLEMIDFLQSHGVDGLTLLGSTGEFPHFSGEDRIRFVDLAIKRSRVPVLVNASHSTLDGAVEIAQAALGAGAAGVLVMPPHYFRYTQDSLRAYFLEFSAQVKGPVYLYNIPPFTTELKLETSLELLGSGAFAGIKDSGGSWENFLALQQSGRRVFIGADNMYGRAARAGAAGAISGTASVLPELMVAVDRRARSGADGSALEKLVDEFMDRVMSFPFPIALREAIKMRGIKTGPHGCPLGSAESARMAEFCEWFRGFLKQMTRELK